MIPLRLLPFVLKQLWRNRTRSALTCAGVAVAAFLLCGISAMHGSQVVDQKSIRTTFLPR